VTDAVDQLEILVVIKNSLASYPPRVEDLVLCLGGIGAGLHVPEVEQRADFESSALLAE
jgi:hypothetical protein